MILFSLPSRKSTAVSVLACCFMIAGCKPSPPSTVNQPNGDAPHQPTAGDFRTFIESTLPSVAKVSDLKTDAPVRMPNTPPDANVWLVSVKITLKPVEDLLALPPSEDARAIDALVGDSNNLIAWRNAYVRSPYAHAYGTFDVQAPAAPVPQLLVVTQAKDKPLAPVYGKIAAEWQVDHWKFSNVDLDLPQMGNPRSSFAGGLTMVKSSPEAEVFLATERKTIAEAKERQAAIEAAYVKDLLAATKPGTTYRGQVSHSRGVLPCEVRFLETPGADPQTVTMEVKVPQEPMYQYIYTAKLVPKVPLKIDADTDASQTIHLGTARSETDVPVGNLTINFVRGTGQTSISSNLAGVMLRGVHGWGSDKPLLLLEGRLKGVISSFNGDFSLAADLTR